MSLVAKRYALGMLSALPTTELEAHLKELEKISNLVTHSEMLRKLTSHPRIARETVSEVFEALAKKLGMAEASQKILAFIIEAGRIAHLKEILTELQLGIWKKMGSVPVDIEAGGFLNDEQKKILESRIAENFGFKVVANYTVNDSQSGIRVRFQGRTYDATVKGWFESLSDHLMGGN